MASRLALQYDRDADVLYLTSRPPYPEQETEELGDDIVGRLNPETGEVESLEILFFSERVKRDSLELPVTADFRRA
jgi:uncharacterized protein YuzE